MTVAARRLLAVAAALAFATAASAHVTVSPRTSPTGAHEKYVVRVPTEGKVATTSIELEIPAGLTVVSMGAAVGHTYELRKSDGRVTGILWRMQINPGEFAEFAFIARNPQPAGSLVWKAVQRFADGSSTQWIGPSGDKHPASVTTLTAGDGAHAH